MITSLRSPWRMGVRVSTVTRLSLVVTALLGLSRSDEVLAASVPTAYTAAPYYSFADSPFNGLPFSSFFLEDFEDHSLNTPGLSGGGTVTSIALPGSVRDSVDGDDGVIDGSGAAGDSLYIGNGGPAGGGVGTVTGIATFSFAPVGGSFPTHVGFVITAAAGDSTLILNNNFGNVIAIDAAAPYIAGQEPGRTDGDRFIGYYNADGISSFTFIANGNVELDHIQYGYQSTVPETCNMFGSALAGVALLATAKSIEKRRFRS